MKAYARVFLLASAVAAAAPSTTVADGVPPRPSSDQRVSPTWCALHEAGGDEVTVDINQTNHVATMTVLKNNKPLYAFTGQEHTTFVIVGSTLWYAAYNDSSQGGTIVAVDLASAKQLWSKRLDGLSPRTHSRYANRIELESDGKQVTAFGHETLGDYIETLDATNGTLLAHKILDQRE